MELKASKLTTGQAFTYGAHDYVVSSVDITDGIVNVTVDNGRHVMGFYMDSTVTVSPVTGCVGYNGWKVHVLNENQDNTLCGARRGLMDITVHLTSGEVSCARCIKITN